MLNFVYKCHGNGLLASCCWKSEEWTAKYVAVHWQADGSRSCTSQIQPHCRYLPKPLQRQSREDSLLYCGCSRAVIQCSATWLYVWILPVNWPWRRQQTDHVATWLPDKQCASHPMPTWLLKTCASGLAPFLCRLFNASLLSGMFPSSFKSAHVTPILNSAWMIQLYSGSHLIYYADYSAFDMVAHRRNIKLATTVFHGDCSSNHYSSSSTQLNSACWSLLIICIHTNNTDYIQTYAWRPPTESKALRDQLLSWVQNVCLWMQSHQLVLNTSKTEFI